MKRKKLPINKKHLKDHADQLWKYACIRKWGQNCNVCNAPGSDVHHFFTRHSFARLRHEIANGIILCRACHIKHHWRGDPTIQQAIIQSRGMKWYRKLEKMAKEKFISFQTVKWYKDIIAELTKFIQS